MDQSLSAGSGIPSRMTLTVICFSRVFSDMRENYSMRRFLRMQETETKCVYCATPPNGFSSVPDQCNLVG